MFVLFLVFQKSAIHLIPWFKHYDPNRFREVYTCVCWTSVRRKCWFEWYRPKPQGGTMYYSSSKFCHHSIDFTSSQFPACIWKAAMTVRIAWVLARKKFSQEAFTRSQSFSRGSLAVMIMSGFTHHRDICKDLFVWNLWPWVYILFNSLWIELRAAGYIFWRWRKIQAYVLFLWNDRFIR